MQELYSLTHQAALWTSLVTSTKSLGRARGTSGPLGSYLTKISANWPQTWAPLSWPTLTPLCTHNVLMARQRRVMHGVNTATPWSTVQIPALSNPLLPSAPNLYTYNLIKLQHSLGQLLTTRCAKTSTKEAANTGRSAAAFTTAWTAVDHTLRLTAHRHHPASQRATPTPLHNQKELLGHHTP